MKDTEYPLPNEVLNIVFKVNTQYVRAQDVSIEGFVEPYILEDISWYKIKDNLLTVQFKPFYFDGEGTSRQHRAKFEMKYIDKIFTSKAA